MIELKPWFTLATVKWPQADAPWQIGKHQLGGWMRKSKIERQTQKTNLDAANTFAKL